MLPGTVLVNGPSPLAYFGVTYYNVFDFKLFLLNTVQINKFLKFQPLAQFVLISDPNSLLQPKQHKISHLNHSHMTIPYFALTKG